jgi:hypothetical protein
LGIDRNCVALVEATAIEGEQPKAVMKRSRVKDETPGLWDFSGQFSSRHQ